MKNNINIQNIMKTIGPGLLFAGAAIGGSHLIQSTRAGANYGFQLFLLVIVINFLKFPFFEYGKRYLAATGKSLIHGYNETGKWAVWMFFLLSIVTGIANISGVTIVSAGLLAFLLSLLFDLTIGINTLSAIIIILSIIILLKGKYNFLDIFIKILILILSLATTIALIMAIINGQQMMEGFIAPEIFNAVGVGFMISLMGWMPAPIEVSVWASVWGAEKIKSTNYIPNFYEHKIDFYIGYVGTGLLALVFLSLGAYVMYGTSETFAQDGVGFSSQLVQLYERTIGSNSMPLIAIAAFSTMASTVITVIDAYPKTIAISVSYLFKKLEYTAKSLIFWTLLLTMLSFLIINQFTAQMKNLIDFATTISFLTATFFAVLNFMAVTGKKFPEDFKPGMFMKVVSVIGIIFFAAVSIIFILTRYGLLFSN